MLAERAALASRTTTNGAQSVAKHYRLLQGSREQPPMIRGSYTVRVRGQKTASHVSRLADMGYQAMTRQLRCRRAS